MRVKVALTYADGRPARTEVVEARGDANDKELNQGAHLQLFQWFYNELGRNDLGPNNSGLYLGSDPQLVMYRTRSGSATVSLARPEDGDARPLRDAQAIVDDQSQPAQEAKRVLDRILRDHG